MDKSENTLTRRQGVLLAAAFAALPTAALAIPAKAAIPDRTRQLIEEHRAATAEFERIDRELEALEATIEDSPTMRLYYYETEADLADFSPAEREQIRRADEWCAVSGRDALNAQRTEALDRMDALEIRLETEPPTSVAGLILLVQWLDKQEVRCGEPSTALEAADRQAYRTIIAALRALA
jgi:hypothetical protein